MARFSLVASACISTRTIFAWRLVENVVHDEEGIIRVRIEREASHEVDDADRTAAHRVFAPAAARALRREVRRAQNALFLLKIRLQLVARPRVVAERDHIGPGGEDRVGLLRRHADDVGVFAVDDGEINVFLLPERAQALGQKRQAGAPTTSPTARMRKIMMVPPCDRKKI